MLAGGKIMQRRKRKVREGRGRCMRVMDRSHHTVRDEITLFAVEWFSGSLT